MYKKNQRKSREKLEKKNNQKVRKKVEKNQKKKRTCGIFY